jgi:hypothetical protein
MTSVPPPPTMPPSLGEFSAFMDAPVNADMVQRTNDSLAFRRRQETPASGVAAQGTDTPYTPPQGAEVPPLPGSGYGGRVQNPQASDTTLESRYGYAGSQLQRAGLIDQNGNWTPEGFQGASDAGHINPDGSWSEQAYREGRIPREAINRYGVQYLNSAVTPPTDTDLAGQPLNPDATPPAAVTPEEVFAVEGGGGSNWVDYGSSGGGGGGRRRSSGGYGYGGGGGGDFSIPDGFGTGGGMFPGDDGGGGGGAFDNPIFDRFKETVGRSNPDWLARLMHLGESGGDGFSFDGDAPEPPSKASRRKTRRGKRGGKSTRSSASDTPVKRFEDGSVQYADGTFTGAGDSPDDFNPDGSLKRKKAAS